MARVESVKVYGGRAYVTSVDGLTIIDISDPTMPVLAGVYQEAVTNVHVVGDVAYAIQDGTVQVLDISEPAELRKLNIYGGRIYGDAFLDGDYAYVRAGELQILDVSNPARPELRGYYDPPGDLGDVFVVDGYAYLTSNGLRIVDVSDHTQPVEVGVFEIPGWNGSLFMKDNYVYLPTTDDLRIIDVSVPTQPLEVGSYALPPSRGGVRDIEVVDSHAYVVQRNDLYADLNLMWIIDISDPGTPSELSTYHISSSARDFYVGSAPSAASAVSSMQNPERRYTYIATYEGLQMVDVSDPAHPTKLGTYRLHNERSCFSDVFVDDGYAYLGQGRCYNDNDWLWVIDVSDPTEPVQIGSYQMSEEVRGIAVSGDYAYVTADSLRILDVSGLKSATSPSGVYREPSLEDVYLVVDNYAYVGPGFRVIDVTDPSVLTEVNAGGFPPGVNDAALAGRYAYVASRAGLHVLDLAEPLVARGVSHLDIPALGVEVVGDYAYVTARGTRVIDVSDPSSPVEVATWDFEPAGIDPAGQYVYVRWERCTSSSYYWGCTYGWRIFDISDPTTPVKIVDDSLSWRMQHIDLVGNYAYRIVENSLQIVNVTDVANPVVVGSYDISGGDPHALRVAGQYAYLLIGGEKLQVVDVSDPTAPMAVAAHDLPASNRPQWDRWGMRVVGDRVYVAANDAGVMIFELFP